MITTVNIQPTAEPLSLNEAKLHLRVDATADDELIGVLIKTARQWCEAYEGRSYMMRTYKVYLDDFPTLMQLSFPPLVSVDSVQYYDTSGTLQTLSTSVYTVDTDATPPRIYLAYNQSWPTTRSIPKAVVVTYKAGYATTFTADAETNALTVGNAFFSDTDRVRVGVSAEDNAALPTGLSSDTDYYVRDVSASTLKLASTSGGTAIDLTGAGTGTFYIGLADKGLVPDRAIWAMKLCLTHLYEHRGDEDVKMPSSIKNLLLERVW